MNIEYIAHVKKFDGIITTQSLSTHLFNTSQICGALSSKIGLESVGQLNGLMHDFGKYSYNFQNYIKTVTGIIEQDMDSDEKGKIDHSTAGAQWVFNNLKKHGTKGSELCGQIIALCIASHHSGLINCLNYDGEDQFNKRINKSVNLTYLDECEIHTDPEVLNVATRLANNDLITSMTTLIKSISKVEKSKSLTFFHLGMLTRFLFSCLIDADRIDSADFEYCSNTRYRNTFDGDWSIAIRRFNTFISKKSSTPCTNDKSANINSIRKSISDECKNKAYNDKGIFALTVPTGGGKTFSSLRFALHHAEKHNMDHIIYIVPFTTIIEQNAAQIREAIEKEYDVNPWLLEIHSNLEPENQTWHDKITSQNWDSPIIITTMVQFLEAVFGGGTSKVRRMHQLANSVIVFDEIQSLPIRCTYMFCNAINFLTRTAGSSVVLCTATQPLLHRLPEPEKGILVIPPENEIISDVCTLFDDLKRVTVVDKTYHTGWGINGITNFALTQFTQNGNCLIIVNTKQWAKNLYQSCLKSVDPSAIFHLSTNQCPSHRSKILAIIKDRLKNSLPVLCISTQLIESGVDIDFKSVIRFLAGVDAIAQAAGRCNRNGIYDMGYLYIINPLQEYLENLPDINAGQEVTMKILQNCPDMDLLSPKAMELYFFHYFFEQSDKMDYPFKNTNTEDTLLRMLSNNEGNTGYHDSGRLKQSFMDAANEFKAIDAPTVSIITSYQEGKEIITTLCGLSKEFDAREYRTTIKKAQKYSVNVFPHDLKTLLKADAIHEIGEGEGVYYLDDEYYDDDFGLSSTSLSNTGVIII